jgi:hypothetical protein
MAQWIDGASLDAEAPAPDGFDFDQSPPDESTAGA